MRVTEVGSGEEAAERLASETFDIAFVDLMLGEVSGLEAVSAARNAGSGIFVVVVSGSEDPGDARRAAQLGAYDFVHKPFAIGRIHSVLDTFQKIRTLQTALIIDDSGTARRLIRRVFERSIFRIETRDAPDGISGFEQFVRDQAEFVFIDINMSVLDGISTARIFRAFKPSVKIVLISGDGVALASINDVETLRKPFGPSELDDLLHRLCGIKQPAKPH
jgi:CheY-like chemotaxis protein